MRITIACPARLIEAANHLAMALGNSSADAMTFRDPVWQDELGQPYAVCSFEGSVDWVSDALQPLQRPAWDKDHDVSLKLAEQAQALFLSWFASESDEAPIARSDRIVAIVGLDGPEALKAMELGAAQSGL